MVAVAEAHGRNWERNHYRKADLASRFAEEGILHRDVKDVILELNNLRKDVSYGEPGDQLAAADLEDIVGNLETFLGEVEGIVVTLEEKAEAGEKDENE